MEKSTITAKAAAAMASAARVSSKVKPARGLLRATETAGFKAGSPPARGCDDDAGAIERPGEWFFGIRARGGRGDRRFLDFQGPIITADAALLAQFTGIVAGCHGGDECARDQHGLGFLAHRADAKPDADKGA